VSDDVRDKAALFVTPDMIALRDQSFASARDACREHFDEFVAAVHAISTLGLQGGGNATLLALAAIGACEVLASIAAEGDE